MGIEALDIISEYCNLWVSFSVGAIFIGGLRKKRAVHGRRAVYQIL